MGLLQYIESGYCLLLLMRFIVAFLFFIQSGGYVYDPPRLKFIL